jgi:hypothetical protein
MGVIRPGWTLIAALLALIVAGPAFGQDAATTSSEDQGVANGVSLGRIKAALAHEPVLMLAEPPTFRSGVTEHRPGYFDLPPLFAPEKAPPTWSAGWHNEFLNMVTPPEFRTWQAFTNTDLLEVSLTSLAGALAGKATQAVKDARQRAREDAARREVDEQLAAFLAARGLGVPQVVPEQ